jgi:hypothetical protein
MDKIGEFTKEDILIGILDGQCHITFLVHLEAIMAHTRARHPKPTPPIVILLPLSSILLPLYNPHLTNGP